MAEVTLKAERPVLEVNVGEERYRLPLTFTRVEYEEMRGSDDSAGSILGFFRKYLGDVLDLIGDDDMVTLIRAWTDARAEIGAPTPGEPSASPQR